MIEQKATVISSDDTTIWLETERQSTCSKCQMKQGCGTGLLDKHVGKRFSRIAVAKTDEVHVGQQLQLEIPEEALLQGAFMMYIVPLVLMFFFAAGAQLLNLSEIVEIFAGMSGLLVGFYWVHVRLRNKKSAVKTRIIEE